VLLKSDLIRGMAFGEKSLIRGIASLNGLFNNTLLSVLLKSSLIRGWPLMRGALYEGDY